MAMKVNIIKKIAIVVAFATLTACATQNDLGGANSLNQVAQPGTLAEFKQVIGDSILFETNQTTLNETNKSLLQKQHAWLVKYNVSSITIQGHADERGTRAYNLALGGKRAASVKAYFVYLNFKEKNITTLSFGKERPVSLCDDISCWSQNRRAVTVVMGK